MKIDRLHVHRLVPLVIGSVFAVIIWLGSNFFASSSQSLQQMPEPSLQTAQPSQTLENRPDLAEADEEFDIYSQQEALDISGPIIYTEEYLVKKNSSVYATLTKAGVTPGEIHAMVKAAKDLFDLASVQSGVKVVIEYHGEQKALSSIRFLLSTTDTLWIRKSMEAWDAKVESKPITSKVIAFQGSVTYSLWQSAVDVGLDAQAIFLLSEIFAWQIDFDREVRPKDFWRILIERTYVDDKEYGWGNIIAAEYQRGEENYQAVRYPQDTVDGEYYTPLGDNLKGKFLKSPLRYSRISSKFQRRRFHPILGINRPHLGVDYAAPKGTPVRAVGDGTITLLGRRGGNGKMIRIRHNAVYETAYKHLNTYGKGLKHGSKVCQGQVIGFVGSTGLATGPHLHFEFYENGRFTDPLGRKFPREDPVSPSDKAAFLSLASRMFKSIEQKAPDPDKLTIATGSESKPQS